MDLRGQLQASLGTSYTLERELGGGGMARVFLAHEPGLHRRVVVKVLSPETAAAISVERFQREIRVAASLQQANIVPVLTAGNADGTPYFTMPYVEGESLRVRLSRAGRLPVGEAVRVLGDVARALAYAHDHGVVHRDIKPDNVLLSGGTAVVTDFGIAKAIAAARTGEDHAPTLTQLGTAIGTPAYMAPEQAAADPEMDQRADFYAFGCMAFEMLTGATPFAGRSAHKLLAAHMGEAPPSLADRRPDTPPALADLVARCLAKEPSDRPTSAAELIQVLDAVSSTSGGTNAALPAILLGGPGMLRHALIVYVIVFAIVALVAKAAMIVLGLPDWVFPAAIALMVIGLPALLLTGYVASVARRAALTTPTVTPGGTPSIATHGTMATLALKASPHVTWKRTARWGAWALGAFAALVALWTVAGVLGVGPGASLLASGRMRATDQVLVADFKVSTADSALGPALATLMTTSLSQSRVVRLVPASTIAAALQRMQRPLDTRIDAGVAREIATREGIHAIVAGEAVPLSGGYVLSVKLESPNGDVVWQNSETVNGARDLPTAVDKLARQLRGRIGESLRSVRADPPLAQVTTSSMEALRAYSDALRYYNIEGDVPKSVRLLDEAVETDSLFAGAMLRLATILGNQGVRRPDVVRLLDRARLLRDRLTEPERLNFNVTYANYGRRLDDAWVYPATELASKYPTWPLALHNAARATVIQLREYSRAESLFARAIEVLPDERWSWSNILEAQVPQRKFREAHASIARARSRFSTLGAQQYFDHQEALAYYNERNYDSAQALFARYRSRTSLGLLVPSAMPANLARVRGHITEFRALTAANRRAARATATFALVDSVWEALMGLAGYSDDAERSVTRLEQQLAHTDFSTPLSATFFVVAMRVYARAGRAEPAAALLRKWDRMQADTMTAPRLYVDQRRRRYLEGLVALAQGRGADAAAMLRETNVSPYIACPTCWDIDVAAAYEQAGMRDSAIVTYDHFVNTPHLYRLDSDMELPFALRRLGELYEQKGDTTKAIEYYQRFVELWKDADPPLQPKVAEIRRRIARLSDTERRR